MKTLPTSTTNMTGLQGLNPGIELEAADDRRSNDGGRNKGRFRPGDRRSWVLVVSGSAFVWLL